MLGIEILLIAAILVLQPLIAVAWAYVVYRAVVSFTASRSGTWVDDRVSHATEELKP